MKSLFFLSLFSLVVGCESRQARISPEANVELVKGMFDAFNKHDWEQMASFYADTAEFLDPSLGKEYVRQTRNEVAAKYRALSESISNIHDDVKGIYPSGDKVFVEFVSTGTLPDGSLFLLPIGGVLTIQEGKIIRDATYYDNSNE